MNNCDYRLFWEETLKQLKEEIGEMDTAFWFPRIAYERASEHCIVLSVPSAFIRDQILAGGCEDGNVFKIIICRVKNTFI